MEGKTLVESSTVYASTSLDDKNSFTIPNGTRLRVVSSVQCNNGVWFEVKLDDGRHGYVHSDSIELGVPHLSLKDAIRIYESVGSSEPIGHLIKGSRFLVWTQPQDSRKDDGYTKIRYYKTLGYVRNGDIASTVPLQQIGESGVTPHPDRDRRSVSAAKKVLLVLAAILVVAGILTLLAADIGGHQALDKGEHYSSVADPLLRYGAILVGTALIYFAIFGFAVKKPFPGLALSAVCFLGGAVQATITAMGGFTPLSNLLSSGGETAYQTTVHAYGPNPFPRVLLSFLGSIVNVVLFFPALKGTLAARRLMKHK